MQKRNPDGLPPVQWPRPTVIRDQPRTTSRPPTREDDSQLFDVRDQLLALDPSGIRFARVIRDTFDQLYDGRRTGRWDYAQLSKTEKTHFGTILEINLQREFDFDDGSKLDYSIAGSDVDCKFSKDLYMWEIPREMYEVDPGIALLVWASDYESRWWAGVLRVTDTLLRSSRNRDQKRKLNDEGIDRLLPIFEGSIQENTLLHMPAQDRQRIFSHSSSGQARVNELFRQLRGQLVNRATVIAVAQQEDCQKRVRDARKHLAPQGIVIFGHYEPHPEFAELLGLPRPQLGQYVSARLVPADPMDSRPTIEVDRERWRLASSDDSINYMGAPKLPRQGKA